jgi:hypothetical protein
MSVRVAELLDYFFIASCSAEAFSCSDIDNNLFEKPLSTVISTRYPVEERSANPFNYEIIQFCWPDGCFFSKTYVFPKFHAAVATGLDGCKSFCGILRFFEPLDFKFSTKKNLIIYAPKCFGFVTRWPLLSLLKDVTGLLYLLHLKGHPIETVIVNLCRELPLPPQGVSCQVELCIDMLVSALYVSRPPVNVFPPTIVDVDLVFLFCRLSIDHIIKIVTLLLLERRMIFFAGSYSSLLAVTESLLVLLYPFFWQHVYIPVLPASMHGVLEAPLPYIVGLHSSKLAKVLEDLGTPHDLVYIDIEKDQLLGGTECVELPPSILKRLRSRLCATVNINKGSDIQRGCFGFSDTVYSLKLNAGIHEPANFSLAPLTAEGNMASLPSSVRRSVPLRVDPHQSNWRNTLRKQLDRKASVFGEKSSFARLHARPPANSSLSGAHDPLHGTLRSTSLDQQTTTSFVSKPRGFDLKKGAKALSKFVSSKNTLKPEQISGPITAVHVTSFKSYKEFESLEEASEDSKSQASRVSLYETRDELEGIRTFTGHFEYKAAHGESLLQNPRIIGQKKWNEKNVLALRNAYYLEDGQAVHPACDDPNNEESVNPPPHDFQRTRAVEKKICNACMGKIQSVSVHFRCTRCERHYHSKCAFISNVCGESFDETIVRVAFLRAFTELLENYREFLPEDDGESEFDSEGFLNSVPKENVAFLSHVVDTLAFSNFYIDRVVRDPNDFEILYFDENIKLHSSNSFIKKLKGKPDKVSRTPFLSDKSYNITKSVKACSPLPAPHGFPGTPPLQKVTFLISAGEPPAAMEVELAIRPFMATLHLAGLESRKVQPLVSDLDPVRLKAHANANARKAALLNLSKSRSTKLWASLNPDKTTKRENKIKLLSLIVKINKDIERISPSLGLLEAATEAELRHILSVLQHQQQELNKCIDLCMGSDEDHFGVFISFYPFLVYLSAMIPVHVPSGVKHYIEVSCGAIRDSGGQVTGA